jgi:hypothetical protein
MSRRSGRDHNHSLFLVAAWLIFRGSGPEFGLMAYNVLVGLGRDVHVQKFVMRLFARLELFVFLCNQ